MILKFTTTLIVFLSVMIMASTSCKKEGCTDPRASNFDNDADKDDGNCEYIGCTDKNAINYDPDAREDNGSCRYPGDIRFFTRKNVGNGFFIDIVANGAFVGKLQGKCTIDFVECSTACTSVLVGDIEKSFLPYTAYYGRQLSQTNIDTLEIITGSASVPSGNCEAEIIE